MARLTGLGLALALALSVVLLGAELGEGGAAGYSNEVLLASFGPAGYYELPQPVRMYAKQSTGLSVAVRGDAVVLAATNCSDDSQLWYQMYADDCKGKGPFLLVSKCTGQAMVIPPAAASRVTLATPDRTASNQQWAQGAPRGDGFSQILVHKDRSKDLNGLKGNVHDGTVVGIYHTATIGDNSLWNVATVCPFKAGHP